MDTEGARMVRRVQGARIEEIASSPVRYFGYFVFERKWENMDKCGVQQEVVAVKKKLRSRAHEMNYCFPANRERGARNLFSD